MFLTFVNINERTYDCKVWNLSGIPCKHATAVLINKRADLESYCDFSKTKEFCIRAYNEVIHPIPDVKFWPPIEVNPSKVLPPVLRRKAGRPRKARRREQGEAPAVGQGKRSSTLKCSLCQQFGHKKELVKVVQRAIEKSISREERWSALFKLLHSYVPWTVILSIF